MSTQKIALFGSPGEATQRLVTEALRRGNQVTAIVADEKEFSIKHPNLKVMKGNVEKQQDIRRYTAGYDVVICSYEPTQPNPRKHVDIIRSLLEGIKSTGVHSFIAAAHPFGQPSSRTKNEYEEFKPVVQAQQEALKLFQNEKELQWGYLHSVEPLEEKPGVFATSYEVLLTNPEGESRIPVKQYASAIMDEAEKGEMEFHRGQEEEEREY